MTSQNSNPFEPSLSQPSSGQQPARRRSLTMIVVPLVVVVALVAGFFVLRQQKHGEQVAGILSALAPLADKAVNGLV